MKHLILSLTLLTTLSFFSDAAEVLTGRSANDLVPGAEKVRIKESSSIPDYIKFRAGHELTLQNWQAWMKQRFLKGSNGIDFMLIGQETDRLGMVHYRYRQTAAGYPVSFGTWIVHSLNGNVISMNGTLFDEVPSTSPTLSSAQALTHALGHVNADIYKWEIQAEEDAIKEITDNPNATYYPHGDLEFVNADISLAEIDLRLSWKFNIYAHEPMSRKEVYVDAENGEIVFINDLIHHADSNVTAVTGYLDTQNIVADWTGSAFRLRETGRGNGIITLDMNNATTGTGSDFTHPDNLWDETSIERFGTDAHFGTESTYDYFFNHFNRNSIDDNGFILRSRVHYGTNFANAFWDGTQMTYGDGNSGTAPFTALDVCGHEVTHGLTSNTSNLVYQAESGALNESFSDIFAAAIEYDALGPNSGEWLIGEDLNFLIRNMSNPNALGDPDTYFGNFWADLAGGNNGGVHTNSGVQNYWFYLLSVGGSGTNDNNDSYSVTAIGIEDAAAIAYRNNVVYLSVNSQYDDARFYALESAADLFGDCSPQVESTWDAWYAVGLGGDPYDGLQSDFEIGIDEYCQVPATVDFDNLTVLANSYSWDFGDGNTSTAANPTHTYTSAGVYTVTLISTNTCDADTLVMVDLVKVGPSYPCNVSFPTTGGLGDVQTECEGTLYDNGGPNNAYTANYVGTMIIEPTNAVGVTLEFIDFDVEEDPSCQYDYLTVYDGSGTGSPIIGTYCNGNPPPTFINSTGGSITLQFTSDEGLEESGFEIDWECSIPSAPPIADFEADPLETCSEEINFTDLSAVGNTIPSSWYWEFGDGDTSNVKNPSHLYAASGTYTVMMVASNSFGSDTVIKTDYIVVDRPDAPQGPDVEVCPGDQAELLAFSPGEHVWYDTPTGGTPIHVGDTFVTPIVQQSTPYYVESEVAGPDQSTGAPNNNIGSGGYFNFDQSIIFDAFSTFKLHSVVMYASVPGDRQIIIYDNLNNVVHDEIYDLDAGEQEVVLNWEMTPGTNYRMTLGDDGIRQCYRNNGGVNYPYQIPGVVSIHRSTANTDPYGYYYFFYDWTVREICVSDREMISASVGECTGIDELNSSAFQVFPNPTQGNVRITWDGAFHPGNIEVYDASGSLVRTVAGLTSERSIDLNLQGLSSGIYLIKGDNSEAALLKRIILQ